MTKQKIHVGKNGPAPCKATKRACRYGGDESHYDNMVDAAKAYEAQLAEEAGGSFSGSATQKKESNSATPEVSYTDSVDEDDIAQQAANAMNEVTNWDQLDNDENYNAVVNASFEAFDKALDSDKSTEEALDAASSAAERKIEELDVKNKEDKMNSSIQNVYKNMRPYVESGDYGSSQLDQMEERMLDRELEQAGIKDRLSSEEYSQALGATTRGGRVKLPKPKATQESSGISDKDLKDRFGKVADLNDPEVKEYARSISSMSDEEMKKERFQLPYDSLTSELLDKEEAHRAKGSNANKQQSPVPRKKTPESDVITDKDLKDRYGHLSDLLEDPHRKEAALYYASMSDEDLAKSSPTHSVAISALDNEKQYRSKNKPANNQKASTPKKKVPANKPAKDHSSTDELKSSLKKYLNGARNNPNALMKKHTNHYSINAGRLNPSNYEGSGSDYIKAGENSLVILADHQGKGVRAISSSSDMYDDPEDQMGAPATQVKQYPNSPDKSKDLIVVGYVSSDGKKTGYVPNKQVSAFVYK